MFINPKEVIQKQYLTSSDENIPLNIDKQVQQAGIDLRVNKVFKITGPAVMNEENRSLPLYAEVQNHNGQFTLMPGAYTLDLIEQVKIPHDAYAYVIHRSSFNRSGIQITGSIYDPGFEGVVGATMYNSVPLSLGWSTRVCQIIFIRGEAATLYDGAYQAAVSHSAAKKAVEGSNG